MLAQRIAVHLYGDMMVWYHMFIIFVMYCMLPVPVKAGQICSRTNSAKLFPKKLWNVKTNPGAREPRASKKLWHVKKKLIIYHACAFKQNFKFGNIIKRGD